MHIVNRRGYFSLESSYRDENGKPRKKRHAYYGRRGPPKAFNIFTDVDWKATLSGGEPEPTAAPKAPDAPSKLPQGLTVGPTDPTEAVDKTASEAHVADKDVDTGQSDTGQEGEAGGGEDGSVG